MSVIRKLLSMNALGAIGILIVSVIAITSIFNAQKSWDQLKQNGIAREQLLDEMHMTMGYGGMIHAMKNYVLRGEEQYTKRFELSRQRFLAVADKFLKIPDLTEQEKINVSELKAMVDRYRQAMEDAGDLRLELSTSGNTNPSEIPLIVDRRIRIDDAPFFMAYENLVKSSNYTVSNISRNFRSQLIQSGLLIILTGGASLLAVASLGITYSIKIARKLEADSEAKDQAMAKILEADQAKTDFMANVSHELRTPLNSVIGFSSEILTLHESNAINQKIDTHQRNTSSETVEMADTIQRNAHHLLALINDILDFSKINDGEFKIETQPASVTQVCSEVVSLMRPLAFQKQLDLKLDYRTSLPEEVSFDAMRTKQILTNLVNNAVKFSEKSTVLIEVAYQPSNYQGQDELKFVVIDHGIGMTEKQVKHLFDRFWQADGSLTRKVGGTGLGLAISHRLTELMGGEIKVASALDVGSRFTVRIPVKAVANAELIRPSSEAFQPSESVIVNKKRKAESKTTESEKPKTESPLDGLRILLAEDGPDNQRLVTRILEKKGADIDVAENGEIALEKLHASETTDHPYDLILMDMQMPVMDGYTATRRLRAESCELPIIAFTAHAMEGDRDKCLEAGCTDYITKPVNIKKLPQLCRDIVSHHSEQTEDSQNQAA